MATKITIKILLLIIHIWFVSVYNNYTRDSPTVWSRLNDNFPWSFAVALMQKAERFLNLNAAQLRVSSVN